MELNANPARLDLDDVAAAAANCHGIPIVISSDYSPKGPRRTAVRRPAACRGAHRGRHREHAALEGDRENAAEVVRPYRIGRTGRLVLSVKSTNKCGRTESSVLRFAPRTMITPSAVSCAQRHFQRRTLIIPQNFDIYLVARLVLSHLRCELIEIRQLLAVDRNNDVAGNNPRLRRAAILLH